MRRRWGDFPHDSPVNPRPPGHRGPICSWAYKTALNQELERPITCGLPAWEEAEQPEARCILHARRKPEHFRERLEELLDAGAYLCEARMEYLDLAGFDFSHIDLEGIWFDGANLRGADLTGSHLSFAGFYATDLTGACLAGAVGMHTDFIGACLRDADLTGMGLDHSELIACDLTGADLRGADFCPVRARGCRPPADQWRGLKRLVRHRSRLDMHWDDQPEEEEEP